MTTPSRDIRTDLGMRCYTVTGPAGAVTWKIPADLGISSPISIHYPVPAAGSKTLFPCQFVDGGCYPDFAHVAGQRLYWQWVNAGRDDEVIWAGLEDWYASKLVPLAAEQAGASPTTTGSHTCLAVRYREHGAVAEALESVSNATELAARVIELRARDIPAMPVTVYLSYEDDEAALNRIAVAEVERVVGELMDGEYTETDALAWIRTYAPNLVDSEPATKECARSYWLNAALTARERLRGMSGLLDQANDNIDREDARYSRAVNVLAGVEEHWQSGPHSRGGDAACHSRPEPAKP